MNTKLTYLIPFFTCITFGVYAQNDCTYTESHLLGAIKLGKNSKGEDCTNILGGAVKVDGEDKVSLGYGTFKVNGTDQDGNPNATFLGRKVDPIMIYQNGNHKTIIRKNSVTLSNPDCSSYCNNGISQYTQQNSIY